METFLTYIFAIAGTVAAGVGAIPGTFWGYDIITDRDYEPWPIEIFLAFATLILAVAGWFSFALVTAPNPLITFMVALFSFSIANFLPIPVFWLGYFITYYIPNLWKKHREEARKNKASQRDNEAELLRKWREEVRKSKASRRTSKLKRKSYDDNDGVTINWVREDPPITQTTAIEGPKIDADDGVTVLSITANH